MGGQADRRIVQCQDCGGIAPAWIRPDGTIEVPDDLSLGGCESHEFVVLNGEIERATDDPAMLDTVFELLAEKHRRYVLYHLDSQDRPVPLDDVSKQVARWEAEESPETTPPEIYDRVEITLTHRHLPKLDSVEYIEYDRDTQRVYLRGASPAFEAILTIAKLVEQPGEEGG